MSVVFSLLVEAQLDFALLHRVDVALVFHTIAGDKDQQLIHVLQRGPVLRQAGNLAKTISNNKV